MTAFSRADKRRFFLLERSNLLPLLFLAICASSRTSADTSPSLDDLAAPCLACHSLDPDADARVGPTLAAISGRPLAADRAYSYSDALIEKASAGLVWDRETLERFLENPQGFAAGTTMNYPGVEDPEHRLLLIDWLLSDPSGQVADLADAHYRNDPEVSRVLAIEADVEYGEYLAGECLGCHQQADNRGGVPPIYKLTQDYFVHALLEYQDGTRTNGFLQTIAGSLGLEELAALIAIFQKHTSES